MPFLLAFVALPLIEIALFVVIGGEIGLGLTLAFVVGSFLLGGWVIRSQGVKARDDLRRAASGRGDPAQPLAKGAFAALAGILLMVPGFMTSTVGLILLIPAVQRLMLRRMAGRVNVSGFGFSGARRGSGAGDDIIDGDFQEIPQDSLPPRGNSGWTRD